MKKLRDPMKKYTHIDLARKKMGNQAFMIFFLFLHHERHKEYSIIYVFPIILYFPIKKIIMYFLKSFFICHIDSSVKTDI